jgi:uncharacterized protein (TIGR04255 family)
VIGLVFISVGNFSSNHVAKYRNAVKNDFPGLQYQPKLLIPLESLTQDARGGAQPMMGPFGFLPPQQPSTQRTWLVSPDDERLIQIQDDAFLSNWRKRGKPYPHFEPLLEEFWNRFTLFRSQLQEDSVVPLQPQQLEVTYINWVPFETLALSSWFGPANASRLSVSGNEVRPEHVAWNTAYLIKHDDVAVARIYARQMEALRTGPNVPHLGAQLELICRIPLPPGAADDEINRLAFEAHDAIVWTFTSLTTPEGQSRWGRIK